MTSVNTNAAATTALRTLQMTNKSLESTQSRISTGLKINEAKDNAAYWAISTTLKSDNKSLSTVKDALGLGAATVDTAYQGLNKAKDVLDEIKSKLTAATQAGVDKDVIQSEISELQKQLVSIAGSSVFSGENWLSIDSSATGFNANKEVVASFSRDASNAVTIGTIGVNIAKVALFDSNADTSKSGILDAGTKLVGKDGRDLAYGGVSQTGNSAVAGLASTTVAGTDAVKAKSVFTGTFTPTVIDANDSITFTYKVDNAASAGTVTLDASHVTGTGFATQGTIGSTAELALAVNNALTSAGRTDVTAVVSGSSFALQRTSGDVNKTVEVTSWTGVDPAFTNASTLAVAAGTNGVAGVAEVQTIQITAAATSTTTASFTLDGQSALTFNVANLDSATVVAGKLKAAIEADATYNSLVTVSQSTDTLTYTYRATGAIAVATYTPGTSGTTASVTDNVTTGVTAVKAKDTATITAGSTVFGDADDQILFHFTDSAVSGGATQTVEITLADLVSAGITDKTIDSNDDFTNSLRAAFVRKGLTNYSVTNSTSTLTVESNTVTGGQVITIPALLTSDKADTDTPLANELGLTFSTAVARGTNAVAATATSTTALPADGITLDKDDKLYFDVKTGSAATPTLVTIDRDTVKAALSTASKASVTLGASNSYGLTTSDTISFNVEWDGVGTSYSISGLSATSTTQQFADKINALASFSAKGVATVANDKLVFTANTAGASHSVKVASVSNSNTFAGSGGIVAGSVTYGTDAKTFTGDTAKVESAAELAKVVTAALAKAKVTGVEAGVVNGKLSLSSSAVGAAGGIVVSNVAASAGANEISVDKIDISAAGLTGVNAKSADEVKATLSAYISAVNEAINKVTTAASNLGAAAKRIDLQKSFVDTLMDTIDKGVGNLIDADITEESTKLQALQVKQQLGVQALSIANQSSQNILSLFR